MNLCHLRLVKKKVYLNEGHDRWAMHQPFTAR